MNKNTSETWIASLQQSGYRITPARRAVVDILAKSPKALDAQSIFDQARGLHPDLGLMTVYRTLEKLEELGLAQRVHQPGGCHAYAPAPQGHQHFLLCTQCNRVEYFSGDDLDEWFHQIGASKQFQITDHWLQLFGLCQACRMEKSV
jgi:Fur family transcriptional regulator, ferric uptake regulator